jgi:hypothetical protein
MFMAIPSAAAPVELSQIIDIDRYPIEPAAPRAQQWRIAARRQFHETGVCIFEGFLKVEAVATVLSEIDLCVDEAYVSTTSSTVYLEPGSSVWPPGDPRRVEEITTVGTLAEDQLSSDSWLRRLHGAAAFQGFIGDIVGSSRLYGYADGLTSVNVLIFKRGHRLGWHFDEAEYAVTLMLRPASSGGAFEYAPLVRHSGADGDAAIREVISGVREPITAPLWAGSLMVFRGRDSLHRVTAVGGGGPRIVAVLSYDKRAGLCLSEHDRRLFYGRIA